MAEQPHGANRLGYWIPAIVVGIMISGFSTHYFSDERTGRIIIPALHWLFPSARPRMLHLMHMGIRKLAHVVEFGAFSVVVFRGVRAGRSGWRWSWALTTLVVAAAYASLDESHQSFVPLPQAPQPAGAIGTVGAVV